MNDLEFAAVRRALADISNPVIVELGAYTGGNDPDFKTLVKSPDEPFLHIMVEPDPHNCDQIPNLSDTRRLIRGAIANHGGPREFHFSQHLDNDQVHESGSLLPPTGHLAPERNTKFTTGMVMCYTLDYIFESQKLEKIDLLFVDIQGAERQMIEGGKNALEHTHFCFMEAENSELYGGQALKPELIALMESLGWELVEAFDWNILMVNKNWID